MTAPTPARQLKALLAAATALCGLAPAQAPTKPAARAKLGLADVLERRLADTLAVLPAKERDELGELASAARADETALKRASGRVALAILGRLHEVLRAQLAGSTSDVPLLGSRDHKVVATLSSLAARWHVGPLVEAGVLPGALRDEGVGARADERVHDAIERSDLRTAATAVLELLQLPDGPSTSTARVHPLPELVFPALHIHLLAALFELSQSVEHADWARSSSESFLRSCVAAGCCEADCAESHQRRPYPVCSSCSARVGVRQPARQRGSRRSSALRSPISLLGLAASLRSYSWLSVIRTRVCLRMSDLR